MKKLIAQIVVVACAATFSGAAMAQSFIIQKARIITVGPQGVIENGDVVVRNGVIEAVGVNLPTPPGATPINASGRVVTPGFFAPYSSLGIEEIGLDEEGNDSEADRAFPMSAALDVVDAYNSSSAVIPVNRAGGITRALVAPNAGGKLFAGQAAVIDLSGRVNSVTRPRAAQIAVLGEQGARRAGGTRLGAWATMRDTLNAAATVAAGRTVDDDRFVDSDLRALQPVLAGAQPMIVAASSAGELRSLIRLKQQYGLKVIALGATEGWRVAPELAAAGVPVIIDPLYNLPGAFEDLGSTLLNAQRLHAAGVTIGFFNPQGSPTHNLRLLPQMAGNAVANGLAYDGAIAALTIGPARMFGLEQRLGSLEKGKAADIVIWDGDPLEVTTRPIAVFIDGVPMNMETRQTRLRDRYRNLQRGDLPFAYRGAK